MHTHVILTMHTQALHAVVITDAFPVKSSNDNKKIRSHLRNCFTITFGRYSVQFFYELSLPFLCVICTDFHSQDQIVQSAKKITRVYMKTRFMDYQPTKLRIVSKLEKRIIGVKGDWGKKHIGKYYNCLKFNKLRLFIIPCQRESLYILTIAFEIYTLILSKWNWFSHGLKPFLISQFPINSRRRI